jgi:hypothetical protein
MAEDQELNETAPEEEPAAAEAEDTSTSSAAEEAEAPSAEEWTEEDIPEPGPHGQVPPEETPAEAGPEMTMADLTVYDTLRFMVNLLGQQAWIHLGLVMAPGKQEIEQDLTQARVAIDTLAAVAEQLQPDASEEEKRELESLLSNLRVNYVQRS